MDESFEHQDICTHDGVLLLKADESYSRELNVTGALTLVRYGSGTQKMHYIEWKPFDQDLIADHDGHEQGDWSFVDAIAKRQRTASESIIFNASSNSIQTPEKSPKSRGIHTELCELRFIEVRRNGTVVRFIKRSDNNIHSEYFFQHGNADGFVRTLQTSASLQRTISLNRILYEVVDTIRSDDKKLRQTFSELDIDEIKGSSGWLTNYVKNPFGHTLELFAKVADVGTMLPSPMEKSTLHDFDNSHLTDNSKNGDDDISILGTSAPTDDYIVLEDKKFNEEWIRIGEDQLPKRPKVARGEPLSIEQWESFKTTEGVIKNPDAVKRIIFRGGIQSNLRKDVWKYLLLYYKWEHTNSEREADLAQKRRTYYEMKIQWLLMSQSQESNFSGFRDRKCQIEKDVKRTDRTMDYFAGEENSNLITLEHILMTYMMYNFDLGYVQGMSDLLAPILILMDDELDAFWCFVGFMDIMQSNFDLDQAGMKHQLLNLTKLTKFATPRLFSYFHEREASNMYFCFRWVLVWFKREFELNDIMELWEIMWTELPCLNFHLFFTLAALDEQLPIFLENNFEFCDILKHVNDLSCKMDIKSLLMRAESIYLQLISMDNLPTEIREIMGEVVREHDTNSEDDENDFVNFKVNMTQSLKEAENRQQKLQEAIAAVVPNFIFM